MNEPFPLDRVENPHQDLTRKALLYRRIARTVDEIPVLPAEVYIAIGWLFYREACLDAGNWPALDMEHYLDRIEAANPLPVREVSVPVELRRR